MSYRSCAWRLLMAAVMLVAASTLVFAQAGGTTASLSGVVTDSSGAVLPGADVEVRNNATGALSPTVTDGQGRFTIPALNPGTYTVKVSLMGFKTFVAPDIQVLTATPASVRATLELGELSETVVVTGAAEVLQTQTASVQTTIAVKQIESLPLTTRTALDFVTTLPGAQTVGSNSRGTTINGLPSGSINITLDGVNVQDNANRADGFFMYIRPLMDSVEEITVSTSTPGAESAGSGSVQIRMTTRAGSNNFSGSVYNTWRNQAGTSEDDVMARSEKRSWLWRLNTPYWFNRRDRPRTAAGDQFIDDVRLQTPGFRVGGPVMKDKLFYFFNLEFFMWPNQVARTRYLPNENARNGIFTYTALDGSTRTLNLLQLAGANGQTSTMDPITAKLFADMRAAVTGGTAGGAVASWDANTDKFDYSPGGEQFRYFPTLRLDWNLTSSHRLTGTGRYNRFESDPDILNSREPRFPGFANTGGQYSHRYSWGGQLRSTFGSNIVNEFRYGFAGGKTEFFTDVTRESFDCSGAGCQGGWNLGMLTIGGGGNAITGAASTNAPSTRYTPTTNFENALTWLKGRHTISTGASYAHYYADNWNVAQLVPNITFGTGSTDPAYSMLGEASGNYPGGINSTQAGYARSLYALLTGRVTQVAGSFVQDASGTYKYLGDRTQQMNYNELGLFVSDSWRMKPSFTLTAGLRWQLQTPFMPTAEGYTKLQDYRMVYGVTGEGNMFKPGTMTGTVPAMVAYGKGEQAYTTDYNNFAPSLGFVWRPSLGNSILKALLTDRPVFRGGYSVSYEAPGFAGFTSIFANNPGATRSATRSIALGNLGTDGLPVLLRDAGRLAPLAAPTAAYPFTPTVSDSINAFDPDTRTPYTHSYSLGVQRELGKNMALEIRYVGNMNIGQTFEWNMNATANYFFLENGFYNEFRVAQRNLQSNIAAGMGNTFAFTGAPGTAPLPIFMAHFAGVPLNDARNQNPASYTSANFRSSAWYNSLAVYNPVLTTIGGTGTSGLANPSFYANRAAAGLPVNFWMSNPDSYSGGAWLRQNGGRTQYDAIQFELRRRMTKGLLVQANYAFGTRSNWTWPSLRDSSWHMIRSSGATIGPDHALKFNWVYELPFGRGRKWGSSASTLVNAIIGNWEFDGVARFQSGRKFDLGGYKLVGMTDKDVQKMFKFYREKDSSGIERIYMWPQDVIANSIIALSQTSATSPTGYSGALPTGRYFTRRSDANCVAYLAGDCGQPDSRVISAPWYGKTDISIVKRVTLGGRRFVEARMDLYNVFDSINFDPNFNTGTGVPIGGSAVSSWQVIAAARDLNASQDAGGRITSFGLRFSW